MSPALNDIERRILDYMVSYLRANTYQPSIREIGERFGIKSTKTVSEHLQALAEKGFLERDPSRSRGVKILGVDLSPDAVSVPCFTGLPDDRVDGGFGAGADTQMTLDRRIAGARGSFLVAVDTDELAVLDIHEGDYVLVEPVLPEDASDGTVVAARPGGGAPGFYRVGRNGRGLYLQAMRSGSTPIHVEDSASLHLLGRVAGTIRRLEGPGGASSLTAH